MFPELVLDDPMLFVEVEITPRATMFVPRGHNHHDLVVTLGALLLGVGYEDLSRVVLYNLLGYALAVGEGVANTSRTITGNTLVGSPGTHVVERIGVAVICYLKFRPGFVNIRVL